MSEILETAMLVCFGFSWPLSVIKNIKSKTAKSMSLPFILLIVTGYIAGIGAKLISGKINYVLVVYLVNFIFVSANLAVFFINKRNDKKAKGETENIIMNEKDIVKYESLKNQYKGMNKLAEKNGVVFFGSDVFLRLNVTELGNSFNLSETLYNRSVSEMHTEDIPNLLDVCVLELFPKKVFIEIGAADVMSCGKNASDFISQYEWLLYTIHTKTKAKTYLVYSAGHCKGSTEIYKQLQSLSNETGCEFIDIANCLSHPQPELKVFEQLKFYIRDGNISFYEAMNNVRI